MRSFLFRRPSHRGRSRGQSLVEFALVFPIFILLLGGMIQFGMIFWGQNTLNQLVRDTGRYAATLDCSNVAKSASATQFNNLLASAGGPWKTSTVAVDYYTYDSLGARVSTSSCPADNSTDVFVNVTASYNAPIFFPWLPGNGHLTSVTDFRVEPAP
jgi:Flp pilus assembly protein TadG